MKNNKVIRNDMVAICLSPGFGAGWSTWGDVSPFEPKVVEMIEKGKRNEITEEWCKKELGIEYQYCGGASNLEIVWLPVGTKFSINEYDGSESIYRDDNLAYET